MGAQQDYQAYEPTVLYDVFYEAGTALGAELVALQRRDRAGRPERAEAWHHEHVQISRDRAAIDVDDRDAQIAAIHRWHDRREQLRQENARVRSNYVIGA